MNPNSTPKSAEQPGSAAENPWSDLASSPDWQTLAKDETAAAPVEDSASAATPAEKPVTAARVAALLDEPWPEASRPQLSESERRFQVDRETVDRILHTFNRAACEELSPDDRFEVELSLDIFDEISEQLDDEENGKNAHDILRDMTEKYDRLAHKAPTPDRRQKYFTMAQIASRHQRDFGDWKAIDEAKNRPKSKAEMAFDVSSLV